MSDIDFKRLSRDMAGREGIGGSLILIMIAALIALAILWASWAELDNVTRGEGRIVSSVQNQMVQAAEGGVILRRFVSENSTVAEGEVLFEIDPVDASSELNRVAQRLAALDIKEQRLRAERGLVSHAGPPDGGRSRATPAPPIPPRRSAPRR